MDNTYQAFKQVQSALINIYDQKYVWVLPEYKIDFDVKTTLPSILKSIDLNKTLTLSFYDAFALKYNLDKAFSTTLDDALEGIKTYSELSEVVHALYTTLGTEEQILVSDKFSQKLTSFNQRNKELKEVRHMITKTDQLKNHLNSVLNGIDYYYNKPDFSDDDTPEVMNLIGKGLDLKSELQALVNKSRAKLNLIKFKKSYTHKFSIDLNQN